MPLNQAREGEQNMFHNNDGNYFSDSNGKETTSGL
jgi:hypothetical protein